MRIDGALVVIAVILLAGIGGYLYLVTASPNGTPDGPTMTLFLSVFAPTVSGLLAAWRANQAVKTALENRAALEDHNIDVTEKLNDLERRTNGGLTARLNAQTRILLDRGYRQQTGGKIPPEVEDSYHDRMAEALADIERIEQERHHDQPGKKP